MSWTLSCGCKSEYGGFPSEWDGETRECEPCVNYGSLCEKCFLEYDARPAQYTHPLKQLSDEEINNIGRQHLTDGDGAIEFARAIIKEITE